METFLIYIGKSAIAAGAFYLAFLLLFQNRKHFIFNRIYLPVSLALSFIIPLITFTTVKYIEPPAPVAESFSYLPVAPAEMIYEAPKFAFEWYHYLFGIYILGSTGFLFYLLLGHFKALHIIKKSRIQELFQNLVNITKKEVHPFSFFNKIVLSEKTLAHPNLELIVQHEKIHVKEKHTLDILFTEILFLLQWFNPFAWLLKDAVKNNLEYKTDDQIAKTNDAQTYQLAMVALADKKGVAPFLTALNGSQLKNRIIMMQKKTHNKYAWLKQLIVLPLLAVLVMGLAGRQVKTEILQQDNKNSTQGSNVVNAIIADVFSNNNVIIPYRLENINEKNIDISNLKIIMDGKEIPKNSSELRKIDFTQKSNSRSTIGKVIKALVPDMEKFEICQMDPVQGSNSFYIRTSDYIPGNNKEFEAKTKMHISLDGSNLNAQYYAINNELVSKNEFKEKGKDGFRFLTYLPADMAKDKYGKKVNGRILDAKTGGANYFIKDKNSITGKVTNEYGEPLDGATVKVKGTTIETTTNSQGEFFLNADKVAVTLIISYPGFDKTEVTKDVKNFRLKIALSNKGYPQSFEFKNPDAKTLRDLIPDKSNEAKIKGYGKPEASIISSEEGTKVRITGNDNAQPLIIVDGKEVDNLENLDSDKIEKIDVIKDKEVTEKYGKKAKDGVVIITTKNNPNVKIEPTVLASVPSEPVYAKVEDMPEFPGGELALRRYIANTLRYPVIAQENGIEGKVYVSFIIDKNGDITNAQVAKSREESLDEEALRVINLLPKWKPGKQDGKVVNVSYTVPISFALQRSNVEKRPLIVINGEVSGYRTMEEIDPGTLSSVNVLKGTEAILKYGGAAKDGAIEIALKGWTGKYKISSQLELRKFIANEIKYPKEAAEAGIEGGCVFYVRVDKEGKLYDIGKAYVPDKMLEQVVIAAHKPNTIKSKIIDNRILCDEGKRVAKLIPIVDIPEFKEKTIGITLSFILQ